MTDSARHTIIIPTYNRPKLLQQLVRYYQHEASHMELLVLDSSIADMARMNQETIAANGPSVTYRNFPSSIPMAEKLAQGLKGVTTPTVSFCADDDVVFPRAIDQSIDFLSRESDFVCSHGLYVSFRLRGRNVCMFREYGSESNLARHAGARIFRLCQSYESLFYAVFHTQQLQQIFAVVPNIPSLHFQELFQSVAALILGKTNRFADFYAARRVGPEAEPGREKWQTYYWFADSPADLLQHYGDYRQQAFAFYQRFGDVPVLPEEEFLRAFDIAHAVYFARECPMSYLHDRLQNLWPRDAFIGKPADLFHQLHGYRPHVSSLRIREYIAHAYRLGRQIRRNSPSLRNWARFAMTRTNKNLVQINKNNDRQFKRAWRGRLPRNLLWLSESEVFKRSFRDLCFYLDYAEPSEISTEPAKAIERKEELVA